MENVPSVDVYVRFCETDAGGHVNNTSYFIYMEESRTKFFNAIGFGPGKRKNFNFIIAQAECDFIAQAFAAQTLTIKTTITRVGTKSFTMNHEIKEAQTGLLIAHGSAIVVCFNYIEQQTVVIPTELRLKLEGNLVTV